MNFEHNKSWDNLETVLKSKLTIKDAWNKVIDFHEATSPKPYWTALRQLQIESEQVYTKDWIEELVTNSPLPDDVVALWIGILKIENDGNVIPAVYLVGSDTHEEDDIDWACDPTYLPDDRYVHFGVLTELDEIIQTDEENYEFLDWILPLAYLALTLDEIIRTQLNKKLFLTSKDKLFLAIGFDDGDYIDISSIE